jgi:hypothetical protein
MSKKADWTKEEICGVVPKKHNAFTLTTPCNECPWRKDVPPGKFPEERYEALKSTVQQGFGQPLFACHKSKEGEPLCCAGYLLVEGSANFGVRIACITGKLDMSKLHCEAELYASYKEMAEANGCYVED